MKGFHEGSWVLWRIGWGFWEFGIWEVRVEEGLSNEGMNKHASLTWQMSFLSDTVMCVIGT